MEFASNGKGNAALTLGIIGTGLSVLNGGLGNVFGGNGLMGSGYGYSNDVLALSMQNAKLAADLETERKFSDLRSDMYSAINTLDSKICSNAASQALINANVASNYNLLDNQVNTLYGFTKTVINSSDVVTISAT